MATDALDIARNRPVKRSPRSRLLGSLTLVTLVCLPAAGLAAPEYVATALFYVHSSIPSLFGDEAARAGDPQHFEILKRTQLALLKSHFVLNSAVRKPKIASLPILKSKPDPEAWLQGNLLIEFPENAEILAISLQADEPQVDLTQIVDAVAKAYQDEVVYRDKHRCLAKRDLLARNIENLNQEIARKWEEYLDIARESGAEAGGSGHVLQQLNIKRLDRIELELMRLESDQLQLETSGKFGNPKFFERRIAQLRERQAELEEKITSRSKQSVDLMTRLRELEQLQLIANEMSVTLEKIDIESQAPARIELIQPAVVRLAK